MSGVMPAWSYISFSSALDLNLPLGVEVVRPFDVNRAGNRAAARRAHVSAEVFAVAASVQDRHVFLIERAQDVIGGGQNITALDDLEALRPWVPWLRS